MAGSLIIVNEFKGIVQKVDDALFPIIGKHINFQYGSAAQMIKALMQLNTATNPEIKASKYPMIALFMPFKESMGGDYYATVNFPKLVIATLGKMADSPMKRYEATFIPVLYPIYEELRKQIARWPTTVIQNPNYIPHNKLDNPGSPPPDQKVTTFNDYLDAIDIYDLNLTFQQSTRC